MKLYADIGNSRIKIAVFSEISRPDMFFSIEHDREKLQDALKTIRKNYPIENIIYACAPKRYRDIFISSAENIFNKIRPLMLERESLPITNCYKNKNEVGIDRLLSAYAAAYINKEKDFDANIIIDFGSATTIGVITKKYEFLGGMIMSGVHTSFMDLSTKTKLQIENIQEGLKENKVTAIAQTTKDALKAGMFYQNIGAAKYAIEEFEKELFKKYGISKTCIVLTGGNSSLLSKYIKHSFLFPYLTLQGLYIASS